MRDYTTLVAISSFLFFCFFSITYAVVEISDGSIMGLYHLEDTTDASGNGNNLTNVGSVTFVSGIFTNGAQINSTGKWLTIDSNLTWNQVTDSFSWSCWIKPNADVASSEFTLYHLDSSDAGDYNYTGYQYNGGARRLYYSYSGGSKTYNTTLGTSQHHLVFTRDGSGNRKLYLDNILVASNTTAAVFNPGDNQFSIGAYVSNSDNGTTNAIFDECFISNNVLSTTTINSLWYSGVGQEVCTTVGCASTSSGINAIEMSTTTDAIIGNFVFTLWIFNFILIILIAIYAIYKLTKR